MSSVHVTTMMSRFSTNNWNGAVANKLRSVKPVLGGCRKDEVYSDSSPHFGGMQSFCSRKERYIW